MKYLEVVPATLPDLGFIVANMRADDWREIEAIAGDVTGYEIACRAYASPEAWVAKWRGQPVAAVGVQPLTVSVLSAWAFGTRALWRAAPALTGFLLGECALRWIEAGVTRVEARALADHHAAHRWMIGMGAEAVPCPRYGRNGEDFVMFSWTVI